MPHPSTIRVAIADDHPLVLTGLEHLLREHEGFDVVARCSTGAAALAAVDASRPDILLLDLQMPDMDGLAVLAALQARDPRPRVVLLTAGLNEDQLIEALRYDVRGVVLKEMAPSLLVLCLRRVHAGGQWLEKDSAARAMAKLVRNEDRHRKLATMLTPREIEIVRLVRRGLANRQIADALCVAEGTVKVHLHNIYEKLSVHRRGQLIAFADEYGLH
ncbi:Response regulator protein VraR [Luteitalea pratensis]|uniref:Response regulator protein VraR n=1 Tax=Luteitalea pratensis TaxID=1855912 RepID=A0A143PXQ5_LUTPR|nr:response regulator transcription factor [Luteitalea pratensis]AMY13016.1 Response regulator protein VraR [Luteitalea pratensis]